MKLMGHPNFWSFTRHKVNAKRVVRVSLVLITCVMVALAAVAAGLFATLYNKAQDSERLRQMLEKIESGAAFTNEPPEFKAAADQAALMPLIKLPNGVYTNSVTVNGLIFDSALKLVDNEHYDYRLSVGNGRVFKTYIVHGSWVVVGQVLHLSYGRGDAFILPPSARAAAGFERDIIRGYNETTGEVTFVPNSGVPASFHRATPSPLN